MSPVRARKTSSIRQTNRQTLNSRRCRSLTSGDPRVGFSSALLLHGRERCTERTTLGGVRCGLRRAGVFRVVFLFKIRAADRKKFGCSAPSRLMVGFSLSPFKRRSSCMSSAGGRWKVHQTYVTLNITPFVFAGGCLANQASTSLFCYFT